MTFLCTQCDHARLANRTQCNSCVANGLIPWELPNKNSRPPRLGTRSKFTISIVRADGQNPREVPVSMGELFLDARAEIISAADSDLHQRACIRIQQTDDSLILEELQGDGVFKRIHGEHVLLLPSEIRIGNHRCKVEEIEDTEPLPGFWGAPKGLKTIRLTDILAGGIVGDTFLLGEGQSSIGREEGNIVFYPMDNFISGTHGRFILRGNLVILEDLNSSNGTFVKISGLEQVNHGDQFLLGPYLIKFKTT